MHTAYLLPLLAALSTQVAAVSLPSECNCQSSPLAAATINYILGLTSTRALTQGECAFICTAERRLAITTDAKSHDVTPSVSDTIVFYPDGTVRSFTTVPQPLNNNNNNPITQSTPTPPTLQTPSPTFSPSKVTPTTLSSAPLAATLLSPFETQPISQPITQPQNSQEAPFPLDSESYNGATYAQTFNEAPPLFDPSVRHPPTLFFAPDLPPTSDPPTFPRPPPIPVLRMEKLAPHEAAVPHHNDEVSPYQPSATEHNDPEDWPPGGWPHCLMFAIVGLVVLLAMAASVVAVAEVVAWWIVRRVRRRRGSFSRLGRRVGVLFLEGGVVKVKSGEGEAGPLLWA